MINQVFSKNKLSKDRLRRVQGLTAGMPGETFDSEYMIMLGDPLVVYDEVKTVISNIIKINLGNQNKKKDSSN